LAAIIYAPDARAAGAGAAVAAARLGAIIGPVLVGELRQAGYPHVLATFVPVVIAAALALFMLTRLLERRAPALR
jgi:AAHS family 3-hydroxyphenylpropionic acid transporter